jgi:hypothetical protein
MTGALVVETRSAGIRQDSWKKKFSDDHVTAFKGPVWNGDSWIWTNTCSCDAFHHKACDGSPPSQWTDYHREMYSGPQWDEAYVKQGISKWLRLPEACGEGDQFIVVEERIQENDPFTSADPMGTLSLSVRPKAGTHSHSSWVQHHEPAFDSSGKRTHAGFAGGYFGAEIVLQVTCRETSASG